MTDAAHDDSVADVDALVAAIGPRLGAPVVQRRDVVLVTGPWLSGVSGVVAVLRGGLPEHVFVESTDLMAGEAATAVVFVVSGAAALTESDSTLLDAATADTDAVIGVVSKIDIHSNWRDVLTADREALAAHAPRYRHVPWVGAAAIPEHGEPQVDDLIATVREELGDIALGRRNRLRAWESRLQTVADRYERDAGGAGRRARVEALRAHRGGLLRQRRLAKSERTIALRSQTQQARVQLSYFARNRCASVRSELQEDAAGLTRRKLPEFEAYARGRIEEVVAEVDAGTTVHLADVAQVLGLPADPPAPAPQPQLEIPAPLLKSRRLETRLMMLVGAGFGVGVALALRRLFAELAPGLNPLAEVVGAVACVAIGLAVAVWVAGTRGLLRDRAVLDRWTGEATGLLRSAVEQLVAGRVLAAESSLSTALGDQDEAESARVGGQVSVIDAELREHAVAGARAAALRGREMPTLQAALATVRAELSESAAARTSPTVPSNVTATETASPVVAGTGQIDAIDESAPTNAADNVF
jgi:hypothetical protein